MPEVQLRWWPDLQSSFSYMKLTFGTQSMAVIAFLVVSTFAGVVKEASMFAQMIAIVIFLALACDFIRAVYANTLEEEARKELLLKHGGAPLLSLALLYFLYNIGGVIGLFLLIVPAIWWTVKSSLAIVLVSVEDLGAIDALKQSHRDTRGRFWEVLKYMAPVCLIAGAASLLLYGGVHASYEYLDQMSIPQAIVIAVVGLGSLLKAGLHLVAQLVILNGLTRLYANFKSREPVEPQPAA
jgi:hypothetical protein